MALKRAGGKKESLDDVPYCVVSTLSEWTNCLLGGRVTEGSLPVGLNWVGCGDAGSLGLGAGYSDYLSPPRV